MSNRSVSLLVLSLCLPIWLSAHTPNLKSSLIDKWKFDFRTGSGTLLSEIPDKYLDRINNVSVPLKSPGLANIVSIRKGIGPHLELGYQIDYLSIRADVFQDKLQYDVNTKAFANSILLLYNLKRTDKYRPRLNYYCYYKTGAISLSNDPREKYPSGNKKALVPVSQTDYLKNVALLSGLGIGLNVQLNNNFSLTGTFEYNRISDIASDIYKFHKLFYDSGNTLTHVTCLNAGISYAFNFSEKKKSTYFRSRTQTEKRLLNQKTVRKKGRSSAANRPVWYNPR